MKYIEKIIIENFQSHKHTILNFEKGVNVIIGPSDSGKTSIIRAIRWVMYNEPSGDYFIRKGETEASVTLYLDNGYIIKRGRSKNKNYYEITDDSNKVEHYEGFGTNVPLEIQEALGVRKVKLSENYNLALNISEQLESPFLLNETPSIKSNAIGRLAGTDVIDNALQKLSKDMYSLKTRLKYDKEDLDKLNEEIKKYKNLDEEKRKIDNFKNIINSLKQKKTLLQNLKKLKEEYNFVELNINKNQEIFENYKDIEIFEKNINIISDKLMKLKY
ncbi:MAG: AAA family ATPase, partial [Tissierellia bacterium]|nr:AAA family ATPase [Tissierellia bacterium]